MVNAILTTFGLLFGEVRKYFTEGSKLGIILPLKYTKLEQDEMKAQQEEPEKEQDRSYDSGTTKVFLLNTEETLGDDGELKWSQTFLKKV